MKIHQLRNATLVIESGNHAILIDPMLSAKSAQPPFSLFRAKPRRNPTVELPNNANDILSKVTHAIITHSQTFGIQALQHTDHLDQDGETFLKNRNIPIATPAKDADYLRRKGLDVVCDATPWQRTEFAGGFITAIPAQHGHGWIHKVMANGAGFVIALSNEPSVYVSGDTVLTDDVRRALDELKPDIAIVAAGNAKMDVGNPLLMGADELIEFIQRSPGQVIANHMEALNHCHIDRTQLSALITQYGLGDKVLIPADGETLTFAERITA
ncbi:MBL fold metallo-hydrolase [Vibrio sp. SM6]|uniref:MBL fold metallo-hydrolase n=1 Tax=Vibrio agarilyticus TaxID=2726741 RepID=A0A7X8TNW3_9VIBR|nr:MBL fold metallo-hydrolase [Vibrio agarilyticus]NLS12079.1 MBL fold metallo-hydrolase [Vibrio agarilyticus]